MSSTTYLGKRIRNFESSPQFDGFSRVVIIVSDEIEYSAGTELGRTLRLTCPWGTPEMARNILSDIQGFQYQPYTADGAFLDPAAELGDGITANNVYSGIYTQKIKFGPLMTATVAAPEDEELNHEYPYKSKPNREITRETAQLRASLRIQTDRITAEIEDRQSDTKLLTAKLDIQGDRITQEVANRQSAVQTLTAQLQVQANQIAAKVSKTGGSASSFGWTLTDSDWTIKANNQNILRATKSGLEVYGKITATSGKIGGFDIKANYLSYNNQTWGGSNSTGIYIGISGIQLGKNFKVDAAGNLTASSGTFNGSVRAGSILYGGNAGTLNGAGITGHSVWGDQIGYGAISTAYTSGGINTSLGYADFANGVFNDWNTASTIRCNGLRVQGSYFAPITIYYTTASGSTNYVTLLGYR